MEKQELVKRDILLAVAPILAFPTRGSVIQKKTVGTDLVSTTLFEKSNFCPKIQF